MCVFERTLRENKDPPLEEGGKQVFPLMKTGE